jgi:hypothetical protein
MTTQYVELVLLAINVAKRLTMLLVLNVEEVVGRMVPYVVPEPLVISVVMVVSFGTAKVSRPVVRSLVGPMDRSVRSEPPVMLVVIPTHTGLVKQRRLVGKNHVGKITGYVEPVLLVRRVAIKHTMPSEQNVVEPVGPMAPHVELEQRVVYVVMAVSFGTTKDLPPVVKNHVGRMGKYVVRDQRVMLVAIQATTGPVRRSRLAEKNPVGRMVLDVGLVLLVTNVAKRMVIGIVKHLPHVDPNLVGVVVRLVWQELPVTVVVMVVIGRALVRNANNPSILWHQY